MGLFGKGKKEKKEEVTVFSIMGYRLFVNPLEAGEFAANLAWHWVFQGPWANGEDPNANKDILMELMDSAYENDFPYDYYVVQESTGSVGVLNDDVDEDTGEIDPDEIEWVAIAQ